MTRRILATAALAGAMLSSSTLSAQAAGARSATMSRTNGFSVGATGTGTSVSTTNESQTETEYGYGYQVEAGFGFARRFSLGAEYANSGIDSKVELGAYTLSHIGLVGRMFFRDDTKRARPYVEGALLRREIVIDSTDSFDETDIKSNSIGGGIGFGVAFHTSPRFAIDVAGQSGFGTFKDWTSNDRTIAIGDVSATTLILRLGGRFYIR